MGYTHHERLTALDETFLAIEDANVHMHAGAVSIYEPGELVDEHGALDLDRILVLCARALRRAPRFRQRLATVPVFGDRVWVDDDRFNLLFHVRHTSLPEPGDERRLKRLAGRIMSQRLDPGKPLWELWFVEGLEERRFAVIAKIHLCMLEGIGAMELMGAFAERDPAPGPEAEPGPWLPRPAPSGARLFGAEVVHRATGPLRALAQVREAARDPLEQARSLALGLDAMRRAISSSLRPPTSTPINVPIGPHRRFDWAEHELETVREIALHHHCTVDEVALAAVSGALRTLFFKRGCHVDDIPIRAMVPIEVGAEGAPGAPGPRTVFATLRLPIDEPDAARRLARVRTATRAIRESSFVRGIEVFDSLADGMTNGLVGRLSRLAGAALPYDLVAAPVPGPRGPAYLLGSRMLATHPLVPLFRSQALGIAWVAHASRLQWGFDADWDAMSDLHDFVELVTLELDGLQRT